MRVACPFFEPRGDSRQATVLRPTGHAHLQLRVLLQHTNRIPERTVNGVALFRLQAVGCELMSGVALVAYYAAVLNFPQSAAAVGTRERRRLPVHLPHTRNFGRLRRQLWLQFLPPSHGITSCSFLARQLS